LLIADAGDWKRTHMAVSRSFTADVVNKTLGPPGGGLAIGPYLGRGGSAREQDHLATAFDNPQGWRCVSFGLRIGEDAGRVPASRVASADVQVRAAQALVEPTCETTLDGDMAITQPRRSHTQPP
jgi:hypothetical protein